MLTSAFIYHRLIKTFGYFSKVNSADALFEKWPKMSARVLEYAEKQVQWKKILNVEDPHSGITLHENSTILTGT